jgi:hypothetical protein
MKIAFYNEETREFVRHFHFIAGHIWQPDQIDYTDNLQGAFVYRKEIYYEREWLKKDLDRLKVDHGVSIMPVDIVITIL